MAHADGFDVRLLIEATKAGLPLEGAAIAALVEGVLSGRVTEAQAAAWLMAVCCRGLGPAGASELTLAMARSGRQLDLAGLPHTADKHSTGGVGDKTSLVVCPLAAAAGATVVKMAGRGLGHTGGTIDKLESIPGLRTALSVAEALARARSVGLVISAQTEDLAPADKRLYALRNETATVDSIPLIAASVMSKKLAAGSSAIVLDVKWGSGALLRRRRDALALARLMLDIGGRAGRRVAAALSPMEQPLGRAVGHALEVREALETLRGAGPPDLRALALELAARMVHLSGAQADAPSARRAVEEALTGGAAHGKLLEMVAAQGGDVRALEAPDGLARAPIVEPLRAPCGGFVTGLDARVIAEGVALLGGARVSRDQGPDLRVGVILLRKVGEEVAPGEPLLEVHAADRPRLAAAMATLAGAVRIEPAPGPRPSEACEWVEDDE